MWLVTTGAMQPAPADEIWAFMRERNPSEAAITETCRSDYTIFRQDGLVLVRRLVGRTGYYSARALLCDGHMSDNECEQLNTSDADQLLHTGEPAAVSFSVVGSTPPRLCIREHGTFECAWMHRCEASMIAEVPPLDIAIADKAPLSTGQVEATTTIDAAIVYADRTDNIPPDVPLTWFVSQDMGTGFIKGLDQHSGARTQTTRFDLSAGRFHLYAEVADGELSSVVELPGNGQLNFRLEDVPVRYKILVPADGDWTIGLKSTALDRPSARNRTYSSRRRTPEDMANIWILQPPSRYRVVATSGGKVVETEFTAAIGDFPVVELDMR